MAKYGTVPYGTCPYGEKPCETKGITLSVEIDWDEDGVFDGYSEDQYVIQDSVNSFRGRKHLTKSNGLGFESPQPGVLSFELNNQDDRYDPRNIASPLYPNIGINKYVRIRVADYAVGTPYPVFVGKISDFDPYDSGKKKRVKVRVEGPWQVLKNEKAYVNLTQSIATSDAIGDILDYIDYPDIWGRNIGSSVDTLPYFWGFGRSAKEQIEDLVASELGSFHIAADGAATFRSRHYSPGAASLTLTSTDIGKDLIIPQPWENQFTRVEMLASPKIEQASGDVWTCTDKPFVAGAGGSIELWAEYKYDGRSVPVTDIIAQATPTDYTANTQADGLGVDISADIVITRDDFGNTSKLTITNNNAAGGYMTLLKVRAKAIDTPEGTLLEDGAVGRVFKLDVEWAQSIDIVRDMVTFILAFMSGDNTFPIIQINGPVSSQFGYDLNDRIHLTIASKSIDQDYKIVGIRHDEIGRDVYRTTWWLEPPMTLDGYWQFPAQFGYTTRFAL